MTSIEDLGKNFEGVTKEMAKENIDFPGDVALDFGNNLQLEIAKYFPDYLVNSWLPTLDAYVELILENYNRD